MKEFSLTNKVILLSGAAGLIGSEIAEAFASAGAKLILLDISPIDKISKLENKIKKKHKIKILSLSCDITNEVNTKKSIKKIIKKFGRIDVLINLAAIDAKVDSKNKNINNKAFHNFELKSWNKSIDVNITGTFIMTKLVIKEMLRRGSGNIINVASTYSLVSPNQDLYKVNTKQTFYKPIDYVATKSVIPNFTRYIATFYGKKGIRANTIVPHGIVNNASKAFIKNFKKFSPMGRVCDKKELRGPFIFLSSDSSSYMNGSLVVIDGGWTAW